MLERSSTYPFSQLRKHFVLKQRKLFAMQKVSESKKVISFWKLFQSLKNFSMKSYFLLTKAFAKAKVLFYLPFF